MNDEKQPTVASPIEPVVMFSISDSELMELPTIIPLAVQIRLKLNKAGFKFVDDNKPSLIVNETPEPLGELVSWYDIESSTTNYKQTPKLLKELTI